MEKVDKKPAAEYFKASEFEGIEAPRLLGSTLDVVEDKMIMAYGRKKLATLDDLKQIVANQDQYPELKTDERFIALGTEREGYYPALIFVRRQLRWINGQHFTRFFRKGDRILLRK